MSEVQNQELVEQSEVKVKKQRAVSVDATKFVMTWQKLRGDVDAIQAELGGNRNHLLHRANQLRKQNVPLVPAKTKQGGGRLDFNKLAKIAAEVLEDEG